MLSPPQSPKPIGPFASSEGETYLSVVRTADVLGRAVNAVLKRHRLTEAQYHVLRVLRRAGTTGLAVPAIAARLPRRETDVTRALDRLEAQALVLRTPDEQDRRVVRARISATGKALVTEVDGPMRRALTRALAHLSPRQLETLRSLLEIAQDTGREGPRAPQPPVRFGSSR